MRIDLKYPIFCFVKNDNMVYIFHRDKEYKTTNTQILEKTKNLRAIVIDSYGKKYAEKEASFIKWRGIYGYFTGMQGRVIDIDFEYEDEVSSVTLDDLKKMILERYPKSRWFKSAWVDVAEFKEEMDKCQSFENVALLFGRPPSTNAFLRFWRGY